MRVDRGFRVGGDRLRVPVEQLQPADDLSLKPLDPINSTKSNYYKYELKFFIFLNCFILQYIQLNMFPKNNMATQPSNGGFIRKLNQYM